MEEVYEFLKACETYYLATVEGDQPRVRPFGTVDLYDGKLTIQTGKKKAVADQMKANQKVELCGMSEGKWIRVTAKAVLLDDIKAQEHMLDAYPSLKTMYQPGDGNTEVYALEEVTAVIASFTEPPKTYRF